jgi:hypothetical protein
MELIHHIGRKFETITPDRPDILTNIQKPNTDADLLCATDQVVFSAPLIRLPSTA